MRSSGRDGWMKCAGWEMWDSEGSLMVPFARRASRIQRWSIDAHCEGQTKPSYR